MTRTIELVPYQDYWPEKYQQEIGLILPVIGDELVSFHHIGSTAIPRIKAKPVIDILIVVRDIELVDAYNDAMIDLEYTPMGEYGIPGRRFFRKDTGGVRSHHIHIFPEGHKNIDLHLNFRDYLRVHPADAQAYSQLKENLAERHRKDPSAYSEAKTDFITEMNQRAAKWREQQKTRKR